MITDKQLTFASNQAVTASAAGATIVDTGQTITQGANLGVGQQLFLVVACTADMTDASNDSTVTPSLRTSATQAAGALNGTINTLLTMQAFPALSKAGTIQVQPIPYGQYLEYLDVYFTVANGNLSTGKFDAYITTDVDANFGYPVDYSIS